MCVSAIKNEHFEQKPEKISFTSMSRRSQFQNNDKNIDGVNQSINNTLSGSTFHSVTLRMHAV